MHEHLGSFTQNPSQKFNQTSSILKNPKNSSKKKKGLMREMHEEWRIKDPYQRRKAWSRPKITWEWSLELERSV